jgi:hypothetical protein
MLDANYVKSLKIIAGHEVLTGSVDYFIRRMMRWYSREFNTPLHDVYGLPLEFVFQQYFENDFEGLEQQDINAKLKFLALSDEKLQRLMREEDAETADMHEFVEETKREDEIKEKQRQLEEQKEKLAKQDIVSASPGTVIPPDIHMTFDVDDVDLDRDALG